MNISLLLLAVLALFGGLLQIPLSSVFPVLLNSQPENAFNAVALITIAAPFLGLLIAVLFYLSGTFSAQRFASDGWIKSIRQFLLSGWAMDALYNGLLQRPFKALCKRNKNDVLDGLYLGSAWLSRSLHHLSSAAQTGQVRWYASSMALGTAVIIAIGLLS